MYIYHIRKLICDASITKKFLNFSWFQKWSEFEGLKLKVVFNFAPSFAFEILNWRDLEVMSC